MTTEKMDEFSQAIRDDTLTEFWDFLGTQNKAGTLSDKDYLEIRKLLVKFDRECE